MIRLDLDEALRRAVDYSVVENEFYENFRDDAFHRYNVPDRMDGFYAPSLIDGYSTTKNYAENRLSPSDFVLSLPVFLNRYQDVIRHEGRANDVDGRIVAAIITWKCIDYSTELLNDRARFYFPDQEVDLVNPHRYSPNMDHSLLSRNRDMDVVPFVRSDTVSLIPWVARLAKSFIDVYFLNSGGVNIGTSPSLVALFFDLGTRKTIQIARKKKSLRALSGMSQQIRENRMAGWIDLNIDAFTGFRTDAPNPKVSPAELEYSNSGKILTVLQTQAWKVHASSQKVPKGVYVIPAGSLIVCSKLNGKRVGGVRFDKRRSQPPYSYYDEDEFSWYLPIGLEKVCIHPITIKNDKISIGIVGTASSKKTAELFQKINSMNRANSIMLEVK